VSNPATPAAPTTEEQLKLPGAAEIFQAMGLPELPSGAEQLTRRQLTFCVEYIRTGSQTEAARRAGYSNPPSDGSKVKNNPTVARFLTKAMEPIAKNVEQLIGRVAQRSRTLHDLVQREMDKPESCRSQPQLLKYMTAADRTDSLLATLLGKIQGVHLTGELNHTVGGTVKHNHEHTVVPVPAEALPLLAEMRREVVLAERGQGMPSTGGAN
jgi:hypothetical protein